MSDQAPAERAVRIPWGSDGLPGVLTLPQRALGLAVFIHGTGSSHRSPRNRRVAAVLQEAGLATLLFDLLTAEEALGAGVRSSGDRDIAALALRVVAAIDWIAGQPALARLPLGLHGSSTGAAVGLQAAVARPQRVRALVSRGGRPDLAWEVLERVSCPVLLIVGGRDPDGLELNRRAAARLKVLHQLAVVPGASHLFAEAGSLEAAASLARQWLTLHLGQRRQRGGAVPSPG